MMDEHLLFKLIPKVELHCHLDGSLRKETFEELAKDCGYVLDYPRFGQAHASLEKYLEQFSAIGQVMQTVENIERIAFELVEDAALENTVHIEYRFCPALLTHRGLTMREAINAAIVGGKKASNTWGISFGVILCGIRSFASKENLEIAHLALEFKDNGVVGFDIAGPESGYPAKDHVDAFAFAKAHGLFVTIHAGEGYGPCSIEQALKYGQADRIGHGTRLIENRALLDEVVKKGIPLEICLTSNEQTGVIDSVSRHPLPIYLNAGVVASLCTDNRLVSETTLTREYERAHKELQLGYWVLKKIALNGIESAFLSKVQKEEIRTKMMHQFTKIEKKYQTALGN